MKYYKSHSKRLYFQSTTGLINDLKLTHKKIHKADKAIFFIEKCLQHNVQPKFCKLQVGLKKHLNKDEIYNIQQRDLKAELQNQKNLISFLNNNFTALTLDYQLTTKNNLEFETTIRNIKNEVYRSEAKNDLKREKKLRLLINEKSKNYSKVEVYNLSSKTIPEEIISFLSMGKNLSLGGSARGSNNCCEVDKLFSYFQNHARQNEINEENIVKIKCNSTFSAFDLEKTNTYDKRSNELRTFLRNDPDLCLLNVDKDISVCFIDRSTYHEKLTELFCDDINFERLTKYNHEIELKSYNKLLSETLGNCLNKKTLQSLEGLHSISSAYGLIKLHKPDNK